MHKDWNWLEMKSVRNHFLSREQEYDDKREGQCAQARPKKGLIEYRPLSAGNIAHPECVCTVTVLYLYCINKLLAFGMETDSRVV